MTKAMLVLALMFCFIVPSTEAVVIFNDGGYHSTTTKDPIKVYNNLWDEPTTVHIIGGATGANGADVPYLSIYGESVVQFGGGTVDEAYPQDNSRLNIDGGLLNVVLRARGSSQVTISGGVITPSQGIWLHENATITFYGRDFMLDGEPISYGVYHFIPLGALLTGILGTRETNILEVRLANASPYLGQAWYFVPEPATLLILGAGVLFVARKKR